MALAMTRPWKHPKSGIYWLRKRVPDDLLAAVGKREEKFSLNTRDPAEAKRLLAAALVVLEERWGNLRAPVRKLDNSELRRVSVGSYERCLRLEGAIEITWDIRVAEHLWEIDLSIPQFGEPLFTPNGWTAIIMKIWCRQQADEYVSACGLKVDDEDRLKFAKAVGSGAQQAALTLKRQARGDFSADAAAPLTSALPRAAQATSQSEKIAFQALLDGWAAEKQPSQKTLYSWKRVLDQVDAFVGHGDASQLTPDDILRWKAALIDAGLRTKTIRISKNCPAARNPAVGRR